MFFFFNSFRNTIRVSNRLDPDQARHFVRPDLCPNCLQKLSADDISSQRVNKVLFCLSDQERGKVYDVINVTMLAIVGCKFGKKHEIIKVQVLLSVKLVLEV